MDDLTRDSWDVMSWLARAEKKRKDAMKRAAAAKEEAEEVGRQMVVDLAIIRHRLETTGVQSVFYGNSTDQFVVANTEGMAGTGDAIAILIPTDPFDLDSLYEGMTGIKPGRKPADPADTVDLTQPAHEAATAPSNN